MVTAVHHIRRFYQKLKKATSSKNRLFKEATGVFVLRITYAGLTFVTSVFLARVLGTLEFGIYTYVLSWAYTISFAANLGFDNLLVREVSTYYTQSAWGLVRGILHYANRLVFFLSTGLALIAVGVAWGIGVAATPPIFLSFCIAMLSIPIVALRNLRRGALKGFNYVFLSLLPELLFAPIILIALVAALYLLLPHKLTAPWVISLYGISTIITLIVSTVMLRRVLPITVREAKPKYQLKFWLRSTLPFIFLEGLYAINAQVDVLMLGALQGVEASGIYVPVNRGANLIVFALIAVTGVIAPMQASLYAEGKIQELQRLMIKSSQGVLFVSLAIALPLIGFSYWYLLLFGAEFVKGQNALIILCVGQVVCSVMGLAGPLLNMTGYERYTLLSLAVGGGLNIVLNALLIPRWGVEGASIATSSSILIGSLINLFWTKKKLGIYSTPWGF